MWPTSPSRTLVRSSGASRRQDRLRCVRSGRHLSVELLEPRQLLSGAGPFRFDFGTSTSPVSSGFTPVLAGTRYTASLGYGWLSGRVEGRDRGAPDSITRDFNFSGDATFAVDLANGSYLVDLTMGDNGYEHDLQGVYLQGALADTITTKAKAFVTRTYEVSVASGQLLVRLKDLGGKDPYAVINSLVVSPAAPRVDAGPDITTDEGQIVAFAGNVSGGVGPFSYHWDFGDGGMADGTLTPSYLYSAPGVYTATLTVTDAAGRRFSDSVVATVNRVVPGVEIEGPSQGNALVPLDFSVTVSSPGADPGARAEVSYHWDFGDGFTATGPNPSHVYGAVGVYNVVVTARDTIGQTSSASTTVSIHPYVDAGTGGSVGAGEIVGFSGTGLGSTTLAYSWDFGDGTAPVDGLLSPTHVYLTPGTYLATLTVTDTTFGFSSSSSAELNVQNVSPTASILGSSVGTTGAPVEFAARVSDPSPVDLAAGFRYAWDFGDGGTSTDANPRHFYNAPGTYTVSLSVTDQGGAVGTASFVVQIADPAAPTYTLVSPFPSSGFVGAGSSPFTVALPAGQTIASPVRITPSDGGAGGTFSPASVVLSSDLRTATFTYTPSRAGAITIRTSNDRGLADPAAINYVSVASMSFDFGTTSSPLADGYTRAGASTGYTASRGYGWSAGVREDRDRGSPADSLKRDLVVTSDGTFSVDLPNGVYNVTLVSGDAGYDHPDGAVYLQGTQVDVISPRKNEFLTRTYQVVVSNQRLDLRLRALGGSPVVINGLSIATVAAAPLAHAGPSLQSFEGESVLLSGTAFGAGALFYHWDFGDGTTSDGALTASHAYLDSGTYTAVLTVTDAYGQSSQSATTVTVSNLAPTVTATAPASATTGAAVTVRGSAWDPSPADRGAGFTYHWTFGDGYTATGAVVEHSYAREGLYTLTVTATDQSGASSSAISMIEVFLPGREGDHTATYYTLRPASPDFGLVNVPSQVITVGLPSYRYVARPVIITPSDGGAGGSFSPASVILDNAHREASFTYTPATTGSITITTTNDAGLSNPATLTYTSWNPVTSYRLEGPSSGDLGTSAIYTVTLGDGLLIEPVIITPSASNGDGTFEPASITLSNDHRRATFSYTARLWGTRDISVTDSGGLSDPAATSYLAKVALGSSGTAPSGNRAMELGGFDFFTTGPWWQELGRTVVDDRVAPNSSTLLSGFGSGNLRVDFSTTTANGGNSIYGQPLNVVPGNQPNVPMVLTSYANESDPGPVPFFPNMSIQGWYSASGLPPRPGEAGSEDHILVYRRNEITGGIDQIYEYYQAYSPAGTLSVTNGSQTVTGTSSLFLAALQPGDWISIGTDSTQYQVLSIESDTSLTLATAYAGATASGLTWAPPASKAGATWMAASGAQWDLTTGRPRPEGWTSATAGGLPISPLMVNYSEAALASSGGPQINHPFRVAISPALSLNKFVWPARHHAYAGSNASGLPMGSRLRMSESWYEANKDRFTPVVRAVVDAMRTYGLIVDDLAAGGMWLPGVNDERWSRSNISEFASIPVSAFEVLDTIRSPLSFSGPDSGPVGVTQSYRVENLIAGDSNFNANIYLGYSTDNGATWMIASYAPMNDDHRAFTLTFKPPAAGTYLVKIWPGSMGWITPEPITFTATSAAMSSSVVSSMSTALSSTVVSSITVQSDTYQLAMGTLGLEATTPGSPKSSGGTQAGSRNGGQQPLVGTRGSTGATTTGVGRERYTNRAAVSSSPSARRGLLDASQQDLADLAGHGSDIPGLRTSSTETAQRATAELSVLSVADLGRNHPRPSRFPLKNRPPAWLA